MILLLLIDVLKRKILMMNTVDLTIIYTTINVNNRRARSLHRNDKFLPLDFKTVRHMPDLKNVSIYERYFFNI